MKPSQYFISHERDCLTFLRDHLPATLRIESFTDWVCISMKPDIPDRYVGHYHYYLDDQAWKVDELTSFHYQDAAVGMRDLLDQVPEQLEAFRIAQRLEGR